MIERVLVPGASPPPRACLVTYGCQMNEADSAQIKSMLLGLGFTLVPETGGADLVILNTCTIRQKAEETVFHRLDHLEHQKRNRPGTVIGVVGCMGASSRDEIEARTPFVDFVLPPHQLETIREIVQMRFPGRIAGETGENLDPGETPFRGLVNISRGCDNNCTFCIVPAVRGREVCFPPGEIERQVGRLVAAGSLEIVLLGQNVNSYRHQGADFADLCARLAPRFPGTRFRFTSPHPKDFSGKFIETMASLPNMCRHVHLPMQSGSDAVLRSMKRSYNMKRFLSRVELLRQHMPGIALSTDVICGFPGETDGDFELTLEAMREIRFDQAFMFFYSPRPGTKAVDLPGHLPVEVRKGRLRRLIDLQIEVSRQKNRELVGSVMRGLVERVARKPPDHLALRTDTNRVVIVPGDADLIGTLQEARITGADAIALFGLIEPLPVASAGQDAPSQRPVESVNPPS